MEQIQYIVSYLRSVCSVGTCSAAHNYLIYAFPATDGAQYRIQSLVGAAGGEPGQRDHVVVGLHVQDWVEPGLGDGCQVLWQGEMGAQGADDGEGEGVGLAV